MHKHLPIALLATSLTVLAERPAAAHPIEAAPEAKATAPVTEAAPAVEPPAPAPPAAEAPPVTEAESPSAEADRLNQESALIAARAKRATAELQAEVDRLKVEKEHLAEKLALEAMERKAAREDAELAFEEEQVRLTREANLAKARAEQLANEYKAKQVEWAMESSRLEAEITALETAAEREAYADAAPERLANPVLEDGTLVISDRRISLNGPIVGSTADHVTSRINYFNNKDPKLPIFIVIDDSPGGSVMSGYRILKAMEGSQAPVYVVVKSFAASMAATIATLAEHSYAYPNAVILHHQMSSRLMFANLNITQQKELYEESQKWWRRLAGPVAEKMGVSTDEFIKRMYENSSSGDWTEFADEAQRLKWIDHIATSIRESALVKNPDARKPATATPTRTSHGLTESLDEDGRPVMYLPRTNPRDYYFLYNPDSYYRVR